jgi:Bacteriophage translational regulator
MSIMETFLEVKLAEEEDFLKIKETLTRIGIASHKEKKLYQSCHILHNRGRYFIVHFKELFLLDGKESDFTEDDLGRRNTIASLVEQWGLFRIVDYKRFEEPKTPLNKIKVLPFKNKDEWTLVSKYTVGRKKK